MYKCFLLAFKNHCDATLFVNVPFSNCLWEAIKEEGENSSGMKDMLPSDQH